MVFASRKSFLCRRHALDYGAMLQRGPPISVRNDDSDDVGPTRARHVSDLASIWTASQEYGRFAAEAAVAAMEAGDEAKVGAPSETFSATADQTLNLLIASSLGLGYLCLLLHGQPPKPLSTAIGAAHGALKGAKVLGDLPFRPFPFSFLAASKALIKGYKASKRLNLIKGSTSLVPKKALAYLRVLNVVRYGRFFLLGDGLVGLRLLSSGYKLTKNVFKAVEDFTGNRFDSALSNVVDAVGLSIKAATVVAELERIAASRLRRKNCICGYPRSRSSLSGTRYVLHSKLIKKKTIDCEFVSVDTFPVEQFEPRRRILISEQSSATTPSELLCLSIPLTGQSKYAHELEFCKGNI